MKIIRNILEMTGIMLLFAAIIIILIDLIFYFTWPFQIGTLTHLVWQNRYWLVLFLLILTIGTSTLEYGDHGTMVTFGIWVILLTSIVIVAIFDFVFTFTWPFKEGTYLYRYWNWLWGYRMNIIIGLGGIAVLENLIGAYNYTNKESSDSRNLQQHDNKDLFQKDNNSKQRNNNFMQENNSTLHSSTNHMILSSQGRIIRQVLMDHSIGSLSDGIFVNIDGYLRNKSGEYLNEDYEKDLREWHGIGETPIYAFFYYSVQSQDDYEYFFTMCILEEGLSFYAFNDSDDRESSWYVTWKDIREVSFAKTPNFDEVYNPYIITDDLTYILYNSYDSHILCLEDDKNMYISCLYFGNYILTDFLNDLVFKCKGLSYQKNNSLQSNDTYQNTYQQERYTNQNNNPSENKKRQDIGALSMDYQFFLDYLRDNPNTTIDESTVSIYNISIERANQLKEHFFK